MIGQEFRDIGLSLDLQMKWAPKESNIILHCSDMFLFADPLETDFNQIRTQLAEQKIIQKNMESLLT